jgi:hypothetical protein
VTWIPIFEVASKNFDEDLKSLNHKDGYRFSSEAQFAMGWWFYTIYVKIGFVKELVEHNHGIDKKVKDERAILKIVQNYLKIQKSTAKIKFHGKKPIFTSYWSWLMR